MNIFSHLTQLKPIIILQMCTQHCLTDQQKSIKSATSTWPKNQGRNINSVVRLIKKGDKSKIYWEGQAVSCVLHIWASNSYCVVHRDQGETTDYLDDNHDIGIAMSSSSADSDSMLGFAIKINGIRTKNIPSNLVTEHITFGHRPL